MHFGLLTSIDYLYAILSQCRIGRMLKIQFEAKERQYCVNEYAYIYREFVFDYLKLNNNIH